MPPAGHKYLILAPPLRDIFGTSSNVVVVKRQLAQDEESQYY
jgi:hypothetical protein